MLSAQFECGRPVAWPATGVMLAGDLGVSALMTTFDGSGFEEMAAIKPLRRAQKKLRRENLKLARRKNVRPMGKTRPGASASFSARCAAGGRTCYTKPRAG